eukprot:scaffold91680_cov98-Cyclotella_meneghiniana.AAC.3
MEKGADGSRDGELIRGVFSLKIFPSSEDPRHRGHQEVSEISHVRVEYWHSHSHGFGGQMMARCKFLPKKDVLSPT